MSLGPGNASRRWMVPAGAPSGHLLPVRTQSCGRYARRASRQGAAAFAVAPTLLRDRFDYSAPSASSVSLSRHMVRISTLLQRDLCRTLRLPQFLDARFEPCDVFVCPREGKLTKFKGLR